MGYLWIKSKHGLDNETTDIHAPLLEFEINSVYFLAQLQKINDFEIEVNGECTEIY